MYKRQLWGCVEFIEKQFNVKFDWDAFFEGVKRYNKESDYMIEKWDVNCTCLLYTSRCV